MSRPGLLHSARRIAPLAWPVFVGQLAVLAFSTIDTMMVARYAALDLAALAVGIAIYITVFVGGMGVVMAIGPITGQLFGARKLPEAGVQLQQATWLAGGISVLGCCLLLMPGAFLDLAQASPEVADKVRSYLRGLAFALPPALAFAAFRGFNVSISRPKVVMALQLGGLALKVPLNALLVFGSGDLHLPALGAAGCGIATAIAMWCQSLCALYVLRHDPFYAPFALPAKGIAPPHRASLVGLLRLGLPMGMSLLIEVSGFTFMAIFISRIGTTAVAGHQIAANLVSVMFMLPLAIANAATTLVAQSLGADDKADAQRLGWHGLSLGVLIAALTGLALYLSRHTVLRAYTHDPVIIAAALPLIAWAAVFHVADAAQTIGSFVLRAYHLAVAPMVIYAFAIWGVGLGGGFVVAFDRAGFTPASLLGAQGFWSAATAGLALSASCLALFTAWMLRQKNRP